MIWEKRDGIQLGVGDTRNDNIIIYFFHWFLYNVFDLNVVHPARRCRRLPWLTALLCCPLLSFVRHLSCHVAALVAIMTEEVDDEGACRTGKQIPALPIPGVPPSHCPTPAVVLVGLSEVGWRYVTTGRS